MGGGCDGGGWGRGCRGVFHFISIHLSVVSCCSSLERSLAVSVSDPQSVLKPKHLLFKYGKLIPLALLPRHWADLFSTESPSQHILNVAERKLAVCCGEMDDPLPHARFSASSGSVLCGTGFIVCLESLKLIFFSSRTCRKFGGKNVSRFISDSPGWFYSKLR